MKAFLKQHWITIGLIALLIILTGTIRALIFSFEQSYEDGQFHRPQVRYARQQAASTASTAPSAAPAQQKAAQPVSVQSIQSWMTFDYVNVVYKLPKNYMKDILGINDPRYPNIRIDTYANQSSIDTQLLLTTVRTYVTSYQTQH